MAANSEREASPRLAFGGGGEGKRLLIIFSFFTLGRYVVNA